MLHRSQKCSSTSNPADMNLCTVYKSGAGPCEFLSNHLPRLRRRESADLRCTITRLAKRDETTKKSSGRRARLLSTARNVTARKGTFPLQEMLLQEKISPPQ
jgi:hypothetical protein